MMVIAMDQTSSEATPKCSCRSHLSSLLSSLIGQDTYILIFVPWMKVGSVELELGAVLTEIARNE